ncbi:MAG: DUF6485 family protein [Candidatus Riflemargulisbacteria bacterium]
MTCTNKDKNLINCNCSSVGCSKMGICCECITYHRKNDELPACYFDDSTEKTWDRSIDNFINFWQKKNS